MTTNIENTIEEIQERYASVKRVAWYDNDDVSNAYRISHNDDVVVVNDTLFWAKDTFRGLEILEAVTEEELAALLK